MPNTKTEFDLMRTEALLSVLCLQFDDLQGSYAHLHHYLAMCSETSFHDEAEWPSPLTEIDVQERRRLVRPPSPKYDCLS